MRESRAADVARERGRFGLDGAAVTGASMPATGRRRGIGVVGVAARIIAGVYLLADVLSGQLSGAGFSLPPWLLGLVGFPAVLLIWQWLRARRSAKGLRATGSMGVALNAGVFLALYLTPWYAPALSITSDAALVFYGSSMLVAALRGYAGCEVLALSNWLLRRDDQVGCLLFTPIDHLEARLGRWARKVVRPARRPSR